MDSGNRDSVEVESSEGNQRKMYCSMHEGSIAVSFVFESDLLGSPVSCRFRPSYSVQSLDNSDCFCARLLVLRSHSNCFASRLDALELFDSIVHQVEI